MISSAARAKRMLEKEVAALEAPSPKSKGRSRSEPEVEPLDPKSRLVRVNLRPLYEDKGRMKTDEWLVAALVESAQRVKGDPELMRRRLAAAIGWCRENLPLQAVKLTKIAVETGATDFPALHHSPAYERAYRPAYRVVLSACLRRPHASGRTG